MMDRKEFTEALIRDKAKEDAKTGIYAFILCILVACALWLDGNLQKASILLSLVCAYQLSLARANGVNMHWLLQYMRVFQAKDEIDDAH